MKISDIRNTDLVGLIENATELFRLNRYRDKDTVEAYIGLATQRSYFYGIVDGLGNTRPLKLSKTKLDSHEDITIQIEGVVQLSEMPTNLGKGDIVLSGYGILEVAGSLVYDGRSINTIVTPGLNGEGDMKKVIYDTNNNGIVDDAEKVNGKTVETSVPAGAVFTDTILTLTDGNGTTANGDAVDLGGEQTGNVNIDFNGYDFVVSGTEDVVSGTPKDVNFKVGGQGLELGLVEAIDPATSSFLDVNFKIDENEFLYKFRRDVNGFPIAPIYSDQQRELKISSTRVNMFSEEFDQYEVRENFIGLTVSENDLQLGHFVENSSFGLAYSTGTGLLAVDNRSGLGLNYSDIAVDEANANWPTNDNHIPSVGMIKANTLSVGVKVGNSDLNDASYNPSNSSTFYYSGLGSTLANTPFIVTNADTYDIETQVTIGTGVYSAYMTVFNAVTKKYEFFFRTGFDFTEAVSVNGWAELNTKTILGFQPIQTTAFTVPYGSDKQYYSCNFAAETEVTIDSDSIVVPGETIYFEMVGAGAIKFVAGTGINGIVQNAFQSNVVGTTGDLIGIMLKPNGILKIV